ncbi:amino acid ABC transporter ATPase [Fervidicella metallireducens AeB]|uniref:Amino acid ABC transporter ATPase n=1 Tax=Fervidicella metallireducens AeB TaxID=1403537 RepID=A0A017RRN0_9CLOT|nr:ABC transporter ATP-binding protein [Fervidicella metallireducens]EYE87423.1 amino acid ABC transporter ATPase [Fervidicella metallireducens AeB]
MLTIKNLKVNYGYVNALKGVDIDIKKGKIVSILGSNGAGKTSLLKAISGLVEDKEGQIIFDEKDITNLSTEKVVSLGISHCPEGRRIFPELTVEENLKIGAYVLRKSKINLNDEFNRVYSFFPKLKERSKQVAGTLSGGEQQMLAIGRALMSKPKLLMLDEPSLGLAPIIVSEIFKIIKDINKEGTTVLLIEQNANQALKISDYSYVLELGQVVTSGISQDLLNDESIKKSYLGA